MHFQKLITQNEFHAFLSATGVPSIQSNLDMLIDSKKVLDQHSREEEFNESFILKRDQFQIDIERFKTNLIAGLVSYNKQIPLDYAYSILSSSSSVLLPRYLCQLYSCSTKDDWIKMFIHHWRVVEFSDEIIQPMSDIMSNMDASHIMNNFANPKTKAAWDALPDTLTVYRGCSEKSKTGFSWSLNIDTAKKFAYRRFDLFNGVIMKIRIISSLVEPSEKERYLGLEKEEVYLLTGEVKKEDAILFLERGESEVFTTRVKVIDEKIISDLSDLS